MDLVGKVFGNLTVMEQYGIYKDENLWLCRCACGNKQVVLQNRLTDGRITNCGCKRRGRKRTDIAGQRFGRLIAQEYLFDDHRNQACWLFRCDCGNEKVLPITAVKNNRVRSCGCLRVEKTRMIHQSDISGQTFGRLTAIRPTDERDATGSVVWECQCECGSTKLVPGSNLRKGKVRSCGCLYKETRSTCDQYRKDKTDGTNISQLVASKKLRVNNSSGSTGVFFDPTNEKWVSYLSFKKKKYHLGIFDNKKDAVEARKQAEQNFHDPMIEKYWNTLSAERQNIYLAYLKGKPICYPLSVDI